MVIQQPWVWKLNYDQMLAVADGMSTQLEFEHFDEGDGMATSQANGWTNPASASLPNGELRLPLRNGWRASRFRVSSN